MQGLLIMDLGRNTHRYYFCIHRREKVEGDSFGITQHQFICIHFAQIWCVTGQKSGSTSGICMDQTDESATKKPFG